MSRRAVVLVVLDAHELFAHVEGIDDEGAGGSDGVVLFAGQDLGGGNALKAVRGQDIQRAEGLLEEVGGAADGEDDLGVAHLLIGAELAVDLVAGGGAGRDLGLDKGIEREDDVVGGDLLTVAPVNIVAEGQCVGGAVLADVDILGQAVVKRTVGVVLPHRVIQVRKDLLAEVGGVVVVPVQGRDGLFDRIDEGAALDRLAGRLLSVIVVVLGIVALAAAGRQAQDHDEGQSKAKELANVLHAVSPCFLVFFIETFTRWGKPSLLVTRTHSP